tara:strand:+ start:629 stop:2032 length:1404 start_codon:yes stop_codon:yes gene_type:complete
MGWLKKIFKPVSKVFDKIIPNEIKPALPYLAAFAPMMMPASFGIGSLGPMMSRGLMSGGLNIGAQLAQEGNEGDINALSALLAGGVGALSAPGSAGGRTLPDGSGGSYSQVMGGDKLASVGTPSAGEYLRGLSNSGGIGDKALNFLGQGADKLSSINAAGVADPFSMAGLKAASIPLAQGTGDLMKAEGDRALKDYERALLDYENSLEDGQFATDAGRRAAIIAAMTAGQHTQQVIDDTLAELGLRDGGIISLQNGGRVNFRGGGMDASQPDFGGIPEAIKNVESNKIEEVSELVELDELDRLDGFAEMLAGLNEDSEEYAIKSNLGIQLAEEIAAGFPDNYMIGPVDLVNYMNSRKNNYKDQIKETELKEVDDGKKEVLMENIKNTSFAFANGGVTSVLPQGMEMDYRQGGFIPMGSKERADDVPARVSKNEFVMTADAVRAAGGGSINQGAKKMYEVMNNLEARA